MPAWPFTTGLHDLGNGGFAWLQPDGGWCLSNAGLIVDSGESLLVDTLTDLPLTRGMLEAMKRAVPEAGRIGTLVNTHAHPDHTAGNELVEGAEIVASAATRAEMARMREFDPIAGIMRNWRDHGEAGAYLHEVMGSKFELNRSDPPLPTRTFEDALTLNVGAKAVELIKVGPAHTLGDVLVHVPADRMVFTGDVLFHKVHPSIMGVNVADWIGACDRILAMDVEIVVPGHGPITDKTGVRELRGYLEFVTTTARKCFDAGLDYVEAVREIAIESFRDWADEERVYQTVAALYGEFGAPRPPMPEVMARMRRHRAERHASCTHQ